MKRTSVGQILINQALPADMQAEGRVLNGKGVKELLREVAEKHPEKYREVSKKLSDIGQDAAYTSGGFSFGLKHLRTSLSGRKARLRINRRLRDIQAMPSLTPEQRSQKIIAALQQEQSRLPKEVFEEALAEGNPLAEQVRSGARGNPTQLSSLLGGDMLYVDHREEPVPVPVLRTYSEGLSPAEWWASSYGARKGLVDVKLATADSGFFSKQLSQLAHRLVVTGIDADGDGKPDITRGLPVETSDRDNEGALLAAPAGPYSRNTTLTPKILRDLKNRGIENILVRSPIVGGPPGGGIYARDVGVRERGGLAPPGDMVGLAAAQAIGEKLTQGGLSSKHSGGVAGEAKSVGGFQLLNQMIQVPKTFKGGAAHSQVDGNVDKVEEAPQGGTYITINGERHFASPGYAPLVRRGDTIEAGDVITEGIPSPGEIVKHKGIGEGRRYFVKAFTDAYRSAGLPANRRNVELIARGLINHVRLMEETDDGLPDDVVPYQELEARYSPRAGFQRLLPKRAAGQYLERPVLHYSIGTKLRPSVIKELEKYRVQGVDVHPDPPQFAPEMVPAMRNLVHDPDPMTRMLGSNLQKGLLESTHRARSSDTASTSYVPALAEGRDFGTNWPKNTILQKPGVGRPKSILDP